MSAIAVTDEGQKKALLLHTVGVNCVGSVEGANCTFIAKPPKFKIEFEKCSVMMTADMGASCSIIVERTYANKFKGVKKCHDNA